MVLSASTNDHVHKELLPTHYTRLSHSVRQISENVVSQQKYGSTNEIRRSHEPAWIWPGQQSAPSSSRQLRCPSRFLPCLSVVHTIPVTLNIYKKISLADNFPSGKGVSTLTNQAHLPELSTTRSAKTLFTTVWLTMT